MAVRQRRYPKAELADREQKLYESGIRQQVEAGNEGKIVAIDIETGDFEVAETVVAATNRLFERHPDAQPWIIRISHRAVYHFGSTIKLERKITDYHTSVLSTLLAVTSYKLPETYL
ncbi:MAG: hypothetical protein ACPGVO_10765 [Spirulinaceae cyanobacterium]